MHPYAKNTGYDCKIMVRLVRAVTLDSGGGAIYVVGVLHWHQVRAPGDQMCGLRSRHCGMGTYS